MSFKSNTKTSLEESPEGVLAVPPDQVDEFDYSILKILEHYDTVLLIDNSGSMSRHNRWEQVREEYMFLQATY